MTSYEEERMREAQRRQEENEKFAKFILRIVKIAAVSLFTVFGFVTSCTTIDAGHVGVVQRFGAVQEKPLSEGIHFIRPFWFESVTAMQVKMRPVSPEATASSKDLQAVHTKVTLQYSIEATFAPKLLQRYGTEEVIEAAIFGPAIQESVKSITAKYTAEQLITQRGDVKIGIEHALLEFVKKTLAEKDCVGALMIANVAITNFDFSPEFNKAIESKVMAEQVALRAENEKKMIITQAQAAYEKQKLESDATAYQTDVESKARADAIKREALALQTSPQLIDLRIAEKWNGQLPTYTGMSGMPLLNLK